MAGITGLGTTFNLPNYTGPLFGITPTLTPLLTSIGGLSGGGQTTAVEFEWQTYDLRDPSSTRQRLEGATAPTAEERVRANARNVLEIHQEKVSVSYTKQSAYGQLSEPSAAPNRSAGPGMNPVTAEMPWQLEQAIKSIALDVNFTFWNGVFQNPVDNATPRKTRGLLSAIVTNAVDVSTFTSAALASATTVITETATARSNGDRIIFTASDAPTGIVVGRPYYVVSKTTNGFSVATTPTGAALTLGTGSAITYKVPRAVGSPLLTTDLDSLIQLAYDNGGLDENSVIWCNSIQRRAITHAYASAYGQSNLIDITGARNIGGISVDQVRTDFGTFGIATDRHIPSDTIVVATMGQLTPVFLSVPGKGVFFEEPLAKTGASDDVQIYGEIGLSYGNERTHAKITGLPLPA